MHPHRNSDSMHGCAQTTPVSNTPDLSQQRCLLIKHSGGWHNDRCKQWLDNHGAIVETIICDGSTLPDPNGYSRVILYGGQSCINDTDYKNCLRLETRFIENLLKLEIPCFGICLGAQLIAHVLGAAVKPLPCGTTEFGYSQITPTDAGKDFMPQACTMLQWHCDGFELPPGCQRLATGDLFPNQAFRYSNNTYGVQFHPEVTPAVLDIWHQRAANDNHLKVDELQLFRQQRDCIRYAQQNEQWLHHFMHFWSCATLPTHSL